MPQVGKIGTIDAAILDNNFVEFLDSIRPPMKVQFEAEEMYWKVIPWVAVIFMLGLLWFETDVELAEGAAYLVGLLMLAMAYLIDKRKSRNRIERILEVEYQWLCLRCRHHWIETPKRLKP